MVGVLFSVDICNFFRVKPMRVLSLGTSRLFMECLMNTLSGDKATKISMRKSKEVPKPFYQIKKTFFMS